MSWLVFVLCALLLHIHTATSLVVGAAALAKALGSTSSPTIVHVFDHKPAELASYALDDVSEACRVSGASAVLAIPELARVVAAEQKAHDGDYPGPLPVIADFALVDMVDDPPVKVAACHKIGASAIGIRYYGMDWPEADALEEALRVVVTAAEKSGIAAILLPEFGANGDEGAEGADGLAARVGAMAALTKKGVEGAEDTLTLGCWNGSDQELQRLRAAGFRALILKNSCRGDVARGARECSPSLAAQAVAKQVKAASSKASRTWSGNMFGTSSEQGEGNMADYFDRR